MERRGSDNESSEDEDEEVEDIEKSKLAKRESRRRIKAKYVCNCKLMGQRIKVDNCLCARLTLAGTMLGFIFFMFYTIWITD